MLLLSHLFSTEEPKNLDLLPWDRWSPFVTHCAHVHTGNHEAEARQAAERREAGCVGLCELGKRALSQGAVHFLATSYVCLRRISDLLRSQKFRFLC